MKTFCIALIMLFNYVLCYSQMTNDDICLANIVKVKNDIQQMQINNQNINSFLDCFIEHTNNIEILEFRNEVLFQLMENYPSNFMSIIRHKNEKIQKNVCQDIERPVHDGINIYKVYYLISTTHSDIGIKQLLLNSLQKAIQNSEKGIEK